MALEHKGEFFVERGFGLPQQTTVVRLAYTPPRTGYQVYDTDLEVVFTYNSAGNWVGSASDADAASRVAVSGDTMTGLLILSGDPTAALGAATKQYVDAIDATLTAAVATRLPLSGGTVTGEILGLPATPSATGAASKEYVDAQNALPFSIGAASDVDLTTAPTNGQTLIWDNANSNFVAGTISADDRVLKAGDVMTGDLEMDDASVNFTASATSNTAALTFDGSSFGSVFTSGASESSIIQGSTSVITTVGGSATPAVHTITSAGSTSLDYRLQLNSNDVFRYQSGVGGPNESVFIFTPKVRSASTVAADVGTTLTTKDYVDGVVSGVDLTNFVTTNTDQDITGTKTVTGDLNINGFTTIDGMEGGELILDGAFVSGLNGAGASFYDGDTTAQTDRTFSIDSTGIQLSAEAGNGTASGDSNIRFTNVGPATAFNPGIEWRAPSTSAIIAGINFDADDSQDLVISYGTTRLSLNGTVVDVNTRVNGVTTVAADAGTTLTSKDYVDSLVGNVDLTGLVTLATDQTITGEKTFTNTDLNINTTGGNNDSAIQFQLNGATQALIDWNSSEGNLDLRSGVSEISIGGGAIDMTSTTYDVVSGGQMNFSNVSNDGGFLQIGTSTVSVGAGSGSRLDINATAETLALSIGSDSLLAYTGGVLSTAQKIRGVSTIAADVGTTLTTKDYVDAQVGAATGALAFDDLTDVDVSTATPVAGHGIFFDGTNFVNRAIEASDVNGVATAAQGTLADSAVQPGDATSTLTNNDAFVDLTTDQTIAGVKTFSNDIQANGDLMIAGDLVVSGTTTTVNSTNTDIADSIIALNVGETGAGVTNPLQSGLEIKRGTLADTFMIWNEATDQFGQAFEDGVTEGVVDVTSFRPFALVEDIENSRHIATFTTADWVSGASNVLTVTQAEHGIPVSDIYDVTVFEGANKIGIEVSINAAGDVSLITVGATFNGRVKISL